jgi:tRNA (guanine37-N1)-methyltransferase
MTPQGTPYKQSVAQELSKLPGIILVAGHYEGYDERIREYVDQEVSLGDFVLTGGELPAMTIVDSIVRLLPGVLGDDNSSVSESFSDGLLEYPQYTRPTEYEGKKVPEVLLGGNHKVIEEWRQQQAIEKTKTRRPDLIRE